MRGGWRNRKRGRSLWCREKAMQRNQQHPTPALRATTTGRNANPPRAKDVATGLDPPPPLWSTRTRCSNLLTRTLTRHLRGPYAHRRFAASKLQKSTLYLREPLRPTYADPTRSQHSLHKTTKIQFTYANPYVPLMRTLRRTLRIEHPNECTHANIETCCGLTPK